MVFNVLNIKKFLSSLKNKFVIIVLIIVICGKKIILLDNIHFK